MRKRPANVASCAPPLPRSPGLRHGLQTWMHEDGIPEVLKTERMGHEMPGMHGVYGHVTVLRSLMTGNPWRPAPAANPP
jgi:hypothetical protein